MNANLDIWRIVCPHCAEDSNRDSGVEIHEPQRTEVSTDREHLVICMKCDYEFLVTIKLKIEVTER